MTSNPRRRVEVELDWYYISKDKVRKWVFLAAGVLAIVAVAVFFIVRGTDENRRARNEIKRAEEMIDKAQELQEAARAVDEITAARGKVREARGALEAGTPQTAISAAREAQSMAQRIVASYSSAQSDASILDTAGKVEIQRANRTNWEAAKAGQQLFEGDFLKTGWNGAAEVMLSDGTLYRIKPETLFEIHRTSLVSTASGQKTRRSEVKFIVGTININTGESSSSIVRTDTATAEIGARTSVGLEVDAKKETFVATYRGETLLSNTQGLKVVVGQQEQVSTQASGKTFTAKVKIPDSPELLVPEDNAMFDVRKPQALMLRWKPVREGVRYRLQIAQSRLFVPESLIVDLDDRIRPEASVTVKAEGVFFWRVAAINRANLLSDWSVTRRLRVLSGERRPEVPDSIPPEIVLERPRPTGSIVFISGKTEAGATVTVNGEPADVEPSGTFKKILTISKEGFNTIEVKAIDGAGNVAVRRERVLIQTF